jgi:hypothetical protein
MGGGGGLRSDSIRFGRVRFLVKERSGRYRCSQIG